MNFGALFESGGIESARVIAGVVRVLFGITVILVVAAVPSFLPRRTSAAIRHRAWCCGIVGVLLLPFIVPLVPEWRIGLLPTQEPSHETLSVVEVNSVDRRPLELPRQPFENETERAPAFQPKISSPEVSIATTTQTRQIEPQASVAVTVSEELPSSVTAPEESAAQTVGRGPAFWLEGLVAFWIVVGGALLLRLGTSLSRAQRLIHRAVIVDDASCVDVVERVGRRVGVQSTPQVLESGEIASPLCIGWPRSRVVLPGAWRRWSHTELEAALAHELAHVKRRDVAWQLLASLVCRVYWFHPLVWVAAWRMRHERELACDDFVLSCGQQPAAYARQLLSLAEQISREIRPARGFAVSMAGKPGVENRILAVLRTDVKRTGLTRRIELASIVVAACIVFSTSVLSPFGTSDGVLASTDNTAESGAAQQPDVTTSKSVTTFSKAVDRAASPIIAAAADEPAEIKNASKSAESEGASKGEQTDDSKPATVVHSGPKVTAFGKVVDESGQPVPGVKVLLREWSTYRISEDMHDLHPHDAFANCVTDENGQFRFEEVASPEFRIFDNQPSRWDVVAITEGRAAAWFHLPGANTQQPVSLALRPESTVSGRVVDESRRPIAGVSLRVQAISGLNAEIYPQFTSDEFLDLQRSELSPEATTDADGRFVIRGLPQDRRVGLSVNSDDFEWRYAFAATTNEAQPDLAGLPKIADDGRQVSESYKVYTGDFDLVLKPGYRIDGQVVYGDTDQPCPKAQVSLRSNNRGDYAIADENGKFSFKGQPNAKLQVSANPVDKSQHLSGSNEVSFDGTRRQADVKVRLPRGHTLTGIVIAEDTGKGVPDVPVGYQSKTKKQWANARTLQSGQFRLVVPPGEGTVTLVGPVADYYVPNQHFVISTNSKQSEEMTEQFRRDVDVKANQPVEELKFTVGRGVTIHGLARDSQGRPIAGVTVLRLGDIVGRTKTLTTKTSDDGRFQFSGFSRSGVHRLDAVDTAKQLRGRALAKLASADQSEINIEIELKPTATYTGRAEIDGQPLAGARTLLYMADVDEEGNLGVGSIAQGLTDVDGRYKFEQLEAGREHTVYVYHTEDDFEVVPRGQRATRAGEVLELPLIEFHELNGFVSGVVVDPNGNPVEGVIVFASDRKTGRALAGDFRKRREPTTTDKEGRFKLGSLPNTPLSLMAYIKPQPGEPRIRFPSRVEADPGQTDLRIILDPRLARSK